MMKETVSLPDPTLRPHLHPLDLAPARRPFLAGFVLETLAHPIVVIGVAVTLWLVSNNPVTPLLAAASILAGAYFSHQYFQTEAWSFIPRRRQDRARSVPFAWEAGRSLILAAVLLATVLLGLRYLTQPAFPTGVAAYAVGTGLGVAALVSVGFLGRVARVVRSGEGARDLLLFLPLGAVVIGGVVAGYRLVEAARVDGDWTTSGLAAGAATLLAVQAAWWLAERVVALRG